MEAAGEVEVGTELSEQEARSAAPTNPVNTAAPEWSGAYDVSESQGISLGHATVRRLNPQD